MPNRLHNLYVSDLTANSTRWDIATASASNETQHIQFSILAAVNAVVSLSCALLIISILRKPNVRNKAFNCYLLLITFPDFISSFMCLFTCALSAAAYSFYNESMCTWQSWYLTWGFTSNCWGNAVIAQQLYMMLSISHRRGRYTPPTIKKVAWQAFAVYLYAAVLASIGAFNVSFLPLETGVYSGFACFPKTYNVSSEIFFWLFFLPAFLLIPLCYVMWCLFMIFRKSMLPPVGRRRNLAIYFFRLVFVYVFMWLPAVVISFIWGTYSYSDGSERNTWIYAAGATWSHLQGLVSVIVSLTKPDIKKAFLGTVTCGWWDKKLEKEKEESQRRSSTGHTLSGNNDDDERRDSAGGPSKRFSIMSSIVRINRHISQTNWETESVGDEEQDGNNQQEGFALDEDEEKVEHEAQAEID